jgi:hypothetical protein
MTTLDILQNLGDPRLVQAMHLSARFTLISPAAKMMWPTDLRSTWGHLVDGGYYDNSGAATALDVLSALDKHPQSSIEPTIIVIRFAGTAPANSPIRFAPELLPPVQTILQTRVARGDDALEALKQAHKNHVVELTLSKQRGLSLPLGWLLSAQTRAGVENELNGDNNAKAVRALISEANECN